MPPIEVGDLEECACCHLVDTQAHIYGEPRCSLCRDFCPYEQPCNVVKHLHTLRELETNRHYLYQKLRDEERGQS